MPSSFSLINDPDRWRDRAEEVLNQSILECPKPQSSRFTLRSADRRATG
jgi:hypothetical protein